MLRKAFILLLIYAFLLSQVILYAADTLSMPESGLAQDVASEHLSLESLIGEAKENNPDLLAAKKRWEAAKARVPQAKSPEDPVIGLRVEKIPRNSFQLNNSMPDDRALSISQAIPFFGRLSLKGKIALVESQMVASEYKQKELDLVNELKNAYYDLFINYKEIELRRFSLEFLEGIAKIAQAKYSVGSLSQEEVLKIHLEVGQLNTDIMNLRQENRAKQTRINTLLNRDPESQLGVPVITEEITVIPDIKSLYQDMLLNQPELIIFAYAIERNKHAKSLAKRSFFPDLMAQIVQRGIASGTLGPWDLMLSFSLPLWFWTKQRYEIKEAIANLEEAQAAYKGMQNKAYSRLKDLLAKIEISKNQIALYKDNLIPIIENTINSSLAGFRTGKVEMMALLDNQRMLVETRMKYYKALVDYHMNSNDLEWQVGLNLKEVKK